MKLFITGISGTGKTSVLAELQKHGYLVIDLDATGLCRWKNKTTGEFTEYGFSGQSFQWLTEHGWYCDIEKLNILLSVIRKDKHVFVSGIVENIKEISKEFDRVYLLNTDDEIIKKRLNSRTNNHFAKKEDEQEFIFSHSKELLNDLENTIYIDANKSLDIIANEILEDLN